MTELESTYVIDDLLLEEGLTADFNKLVIDKISKHHGWYLSIDDILENNQLDSKYSDTGMLLESFYNQTVKRVDHSEINEIANLILEYVLTKAPIQFHNPKLVRFLWNYYGRSSCGVEHRDISQQIKGNFCSIVYHLNTCDGETQVEDKNYPSKSGQCIIFNSKKLHRGTGPKLDRKRFCLNIVINYDTLKLI
ncbi:hypothetical protein EBQ93_01715 [bacterium]|nr:hypothetical protein [bacterium]